MRASRSREQMGARQPQGPRCRRRDTQQAQLRRFPRRRIRREARLRRANVLSLSRHVPSRAGQTDTRILRSARGGSPGSANGTWSAAV